MNSCDQPVHVPDCTQVFLRDLYTQHSFDQILSRCEKLPIVPYRRRKLEDTYHSDNTEYEQGTKYRDPETHITLAVIFRYTDIMGETTETIRALRIGNTVYDAVVHFKHS